MSGSVKKPPVEDASGFITRKYTEYRALLDDALEAGAMSSPILSESVEQIPGGGFQSVIKITFSVQEYKLHAFRTARNKT